MIKLLALSLPLLFGLGILLGAALMGGFLSLWRNKPNPMDVAILSAVWLNIGLLVAIWQWGK